MTRLGPGLVLVLALAHVGSGCADPEVPSDDDDEPAQPATCAAGDDTCDPYDQTNFVGTQATALCSFLFDCCSGVERNDVVPLLLASGDAARGDALLDQLLVVEPELLADELACVRALALAQSAALRDAAVALLDEDGARRAFDRDAAETCIKQVEEAAVLCAPPLLFLAEAVPAECAVIFAPAVGEGGTCASDADCEDIDNEAATCFANDGPGDGGFDVSLTGTCERVPALDEACAFEGGTCESGLFCSSALVCLPESGAGEPCGDAPCAAGLRCLGTCAPLVPSGEDPAVNLCAFDEDCASGLCVEVRGPFGPGGAEITLGFCTDPPAIDPLDVRFDFCLGDQGNASLRDVVPPG